MNDERLQRWRSKTTLSSMNCPPADSWFTPELLYYTNFMNYRQYDSDHPRSFSLTGLKLPKTHQTPDRKVFFIWFCCFIPKNKERKFQSTEANHNIWHSINCYASLFLSSENSSQIQMCDFSQCKLNGMLWNFSRSIFKRNQAVVSVALPVRAVWMLHHWISDMLVCNVYDYEWSWSSSWVAKILQIEASVWDEEVHVASSVNPFHHPSPSFFYSADWFIGAHWGAKISVSLPALWWTTQTRVSHSAEPLQSTTHFRVWVHRFQGLHVCTGVMDRSRKGGGRLTRLHL